MIVVAGAAVVALAVILPLVAGGSKSPNRPATAGGVSVGDMARLPGIELGKPPWPAEHAELRARLASLGIPALPQEALQVHNHQHLDVYVNGVHEVVPAFIGIDLAGRFIAPVHTHDASGVIHRESPNGYPYTLGQFFGIWGVRLSRTCIGGLCAKARSTLRVFVNGHLFAGDPTRIVLEPHDEYAIVYGKPPAHVPTSYTFGPGL